MNFDSSRNINLRMITNKDNLIKFLKLKRLSAMDIYG